MSGTANQVEQRPPWDFAGTARDRRALPFDTARKPDGPHTIRVKVVSLASRGATVEAQFQIANFFELTASRSADRSDPSALQGREVGGTIYVFVRPVARIKEVKFFLDDPGMLRPPRQTERYAPWDFAGSDNDRSAVAFSTRTLSTGAHTITAAPRGRPIPPSRLRRRSPGGARRQGCRYGAHLGRPTVEGNRLYPWRTSLWTKEPAR